MAGRLEGKVGLITGAARGQGAAEAELFAREGARLLITDILEEPLAKLAEEISSGGHEIVARRLDVQEEEPWSEAASFAEKRFGRIDFLINNAGIADPAGIEDTTRERWDQIIAINQTGVWLGMRAVLPAMRRAGGGSIVNISSIFGIIGSGTSAAYHGTKGAVRLLTKTAAVEYASESIRVNSIHPGYIDTPMAREAVPEDMRDQFAPLIAATVPLGRMGVSQDIAYGALYLASDESAYMTGSELVIDGGVTAR
ncbi:MAG: glucose 1-dehydrogenase [Deltaproteobacteria bacterium]|nr:glucose 1-dehydrogenase [Deltaproteobacteria bacterium]MBW2361928.1 glucose 1-dehydrogenase [Deltaproteobacteria bacterium]